MRRRFLMGSHKARLPKEYQEVAYIESTGTQYIDTGVRPTSTMGIKVVMSDLQKTQWQVDFNFLGARVSGGARFALCYSHGKYAFGYDIIYSTQKEFILQDKNTISMNFTNDRSLRVNGEILVDGLPTVDLSVIGAPILIFGQSTFFGSFANISLYQYRVYSFAITENEEAIRDYVPCYRKTDNVAGVYDLVEGVFYTNAGTEEFLIGGAI